MGEFRPPTEAELAALDRCGLTNRPGQLVLLEHRRLLTDRIYRRAVRTKLIEFRHVRWLVSCEGDLSCCAMEAWKATEAKLMAELAEDGWFAGPPPAEEVARG